MRTLFSLDKDKKCHAIAYAKTRAKEMEIREDWKRSWPNRTTYSILGTHRGTGKAVVSIKDNEIETDVNGDPVTSPDPNLIVEEEIEHAKEKYLLQQIKSSVGAKARSKINEKIKQLNR